VDQVSLSTRSLRTVCVYCGSSTQVDQKYLDIARRLGSAIAQRGVRLIYGGGGLGLMGATALGAHRAGGKVLGVLPNFLETREPPPPEIALHRVDTMHERKRFMFEESDGFIVLPGGIGTLEEAVETLSWRRLDLHDKPMVFVDSEFWGPFFATLEHMVQRGFAPPIFRESYRAVEEPEEALDALENAIQGITPSPVS
jgi:uncharacterized protein (TIGR00730 family)